MKTVDEAVLFTRVLLSDLKPNKVCLGALSLGMNVTYKEMYLQIICICACHVENTWNSRVSSPLSETESVLPVCCMKMNEIK